MPLDMSFGQIVQPNINDNMSMLEQSQATYSALGQTQLNQQNSVFGAGGKVDQGMGLAGKGIAIGSSLAQMYVGLKSLGLAEEELGIKKEQWAMSKQELQHMQATRKRLPNSYMGNGPTNNRAQVASSGGPGPTANKASAMAGRY